MVPEKAQNRPVGKRLLLTLALFSITAMNCFTIRGDGPSGFGELFIKVVIFLTSIALVIASSISLNKIERNINQTSLPSKIYLYSTLLLAALAMLAVADACSDLGGYCRRDGIHLHSQ